MDKKRARTEYEDMLYRCGLADSKEYWEKRLPKTESIRPKRAPRRALSENQENAIVVENGALGSIQELLKALLATTLQKIIAAVPAQYKRDGVKVQGSPGLAMLAFLDGRQVDVVPARVEIKLAIDPNTLREIECTVALDDGTYDPRDYRNEMEVFRIDWTAPVEDLVGMVSRYLNSKRHGVGARNR